MSADSVTPFGFEAFPVRGALIHLSRTWRRMLRDHDYDALVTETLGHAAAATALIAQSLKFDGAITLQIQSTGTLQMLVMQCTSKLDVRGMAAVEEGTAATSFAELTSKAHCAVTVDAGDRPYQGIVEIDDTSLAASLEHYFARSVQVPSHVALHTLSPRDFESDTSLQLIGKLFAEDDVRVYEPRPVNFRCRCSVRKVEDVLKMLGEEEARQTLEQQGEIEVICEYCGRRRHFDAVDVQRLFADNVVSGPDSVQ
jgi:molecular chaperone Hsp33